MHFLAYGWLGVCAGVAGLMQAHYVQEVVPNALYGRELDVLAAVVLGGARLGGGRGTILGVILGVLLIAITQNGLNLLGISPYAFQMLIGVVLLAAITTTNVSLERLVGWHRRGAGADLNRRGAGAAGRLDLAALIRTGRGEYLGLGLLLIAVIVLFGWTTPRFLTLATFQSIAFQMPELGILTLAMLIPILSGGLNLAVTFAANICGLTAAWILQSLGGPEAGVAGFSLALAGALALGMLIGWSMGLIVAYVGAHPILVSLAFMIFLRGVGEFLTRGGDISGFPAFVGDIGHGTVLGIPIPFLVFAGCAVWWHVLLGRAPLGFSIYMVGSNIEATRYSGVDTKRVLTLIYTLSGLMCAVAGVVMLTRFNSVRVGHGEAYLLITVLACFLGGVDPFGGFGRTASVVLALVILQVISSGLNLLGANQHLATALWGSFLVVVMVARFVVLRIRAGPRLGA